MSDDFVIGLLALVALLAVLWVIGCGPYLVGEYLARRRARRQPPFP